MLDDGEELQGSLAQTTSGKQVGKRCALDPFLPPVAKRPVTVSSSPSNQITETDLTRTIDFLRTKKEVCPSTTARASWFV